jgi:D-methionine transport system ATP-binding protein
LHASDPPLFALEQVSLQASAGPYSLLQDLSFAVRPGARLGIVGPSGAGKTSLFRLLNRLEETSQGRIWFEGQDIRSIPVVQLRQQITLVSQETKLLGMTVRRALEYPLMIRGLDHQQIEQRLLYWTERLHIPTEWFDRTELQLSVGQRQIVSIARALMIQPKLLLLDEPTSALDAGRADYLVSVLRELAVSQTLTVAMVNHQLDLMEQFCDQLLLLQQGRLIQNLPAQQVNWPELKQTLIEEQEKVAEEWM